MKVIINHIWCNDIYRLHWFWILDFLNIIFIIFTDHNNSDGKTVKLSQKL